MEAILVIVIVVAAGIIKDRNFYGRTDLLKEKLKKNGDC
jgi:hypothetical protein